MEDRYILLSIFIRLKFRDPAKLARFIVGKMPSKKAKQGLTSAEPNGYTETSTSNRRKNNTGAPGASGRKKHGNITVQSNKEQHAHISSGSIKKEHRNIRIESNEELH